LKKKKIIAYLFAYIPIIIALLIQAVDKDGSYRLVQYALLIFMVVSLIIYKILKK